MEAGYQRRVVRFDDDSACGVSLMRVGATATNRPALTAPTHVK